MEKKDQDQHKTSYIKDEERVARKIYTIEVCTKKDGIEVCKTQSLDCFKEEAKELFLKAERRKGYLKDKEEKLKKERARQIIEEARIKKPSLFKDEDLER